MLKEILVKWLPHKLFTFAINQVHAGLVLWNSFLYAGMLAKEDSPSSNQLAKRIQFRLTARLIDLMDAHYKKVYTDFEQGLKETACQNLNPQNYVGLIFMLGTLGPGGAERQAVVTMLNLHQQNFPTSAIITFFAKNQIDNFYTESLASRSIPVLSLSHEAALLKNSESLDPIVKLIQKLPRVIRKHLTKSLSVLATKRPAILHLWLDEINIRAGITAVALKIPKIVLSTRSLPPIHFGFCRFYMREGYRWLARQPGVIILNNSFIGAHAYESWLGLPHGTIKVVQNGFEFDEHKLNALITQRLTYRIPFKINKSALLVGTVIRLGEEKRPFLWLDIAARIHEKEPDVVFMIVGDGPLRTKLQQYSHKLGLENNLHFIGHSKDPFPLLASMDLFLLTSRIEGLPNVLIEAQALGVPVISTNVGGAPETFEHTKSGWLLQNDDPNAAAQIIITLLNDKQWRQTASAAGKAFVQKTFSMQKMIQNTIEVYESSGHVKPS